MKKIYMNPEMEIIEIKMQGPVLLPVSQTEVNSGLAREFDFEEGLF